MTKMEKVDFLENRIKERSENFGILLRTLTELLNKIEKARFIGEEDVEFNSLLSFIHGTCFGLGFLSHKEHENLSR